MKSATLRSEFVTDTIGLVLRLEGRKTGLASRSAFDAAEAGKATVYIPAVVFAEILYLSEKRRIRVSLADVANYIKRYPQYREYPLSLSVVQASAHITDVRELHDRLIAGTARLLGLDLITNDAVIQESAFVGTVW